MIAKVADKLENKVNHEKVKSEENVEDEGGERRTNEKENEKRKNRVERRERNGEKRKEKIFFLLKASFKVIKTYRSRERGGLADDRALQTLRNASVTT